jgi:cellulose synthase/poly-beta-1,6-N-acetylglucosamine synthase-like glycosyltransferase
MIGLEYITRITEYILFIYLGFATVYIALFGTAGLFRYRMKILPETQFRKIAVMIPGYKEDTVILETAREALNQTYPKTFYDIFIIADSFHSETLTRLREMNVTVIEVVFEKSSKAKALNKAMSVIPAGYQIAVILDADNIMATDFLARINQTFESGCLAVQGHRLAKNTNTSFAILDAISEEINNHIFRKGHRVLGLSSALIGSGMAFDYNFYRQIMAGITSHGEDKELEFNILGRCIKIEYLHNALVWDEKVQKSAVFEKQRKRWLSVQLEHFRKYFGTGLVQLMTKGNFDLFDKVLQMILPPRILHLGIVLFLTVFSALRIIFTSLYQWFTVPLTGWILICGLTLFALLVSIPRHHYNRKTLGALGTIPHAFMIMFGLLFRLKGANRNFIHTEHGVTNKK